MAFRRPTPDELRLLKELARIARIQNPDGWLSRLQVQKMNDSGMGSLNLVTPEPIGRGPSLVDCKAVVQFTDEDGVEVIASLNADENGNPFELDVWKTDFSSLIRIPNEFRLVEK